MRKIIIAVILALGLLLVPSIASATSSITVVDRTGDGVWTGNIWQVEMFPGEEKATTLTLHNTSSESLGVEIKVTPNSLDNGNLVFRLDRSSFTMHSKSYTNVTLTVEASNSTTPDTYTTELEIKSELPTDGDGGGGGGTSKLSITHIEVEDVTETTAVITWQTSSSARTLLTYWNGDKDTVRDNKYIRYHSITLESLEPDTEYEFRIKCYNRYDSTDSEDGKFTTASKPEEPTEPEEPAKPEEPEPVVPKPTPPKPTPSVPPTTPPSITPPATPEQPVPWLLIGGLVAIAILIAVGGIIWKRRQRS